MRTRALEIVEANAFLAPLPWAGQFVVKESRSVREAGK
jgi:hypothetical protein